jgi:hypothetical protein
MSTRDENGTRIIEFRHIIAKPHVLDGQPLCRVNQRLTIRPTGEISIVYDFEWLKTLRWTGFGLLLIFDDRPCRGREYLVRASGKYLAGRLAGESVEETRIRHMAFEQLTIRTDHGPVHVTWQADARCSMHWRTRPQLHISPPSTPHRGFIYQGMTDRIAYTILLPVSQQ